MSLICYDFPAFISPENIPPRNSDVDYRFLEAAKAGDLDTVKVNNSLTCSKSISLLQCDVKQDVKWYVFFLKEFIRQ